MDNGRIIAYLKTPRYLGNCDKLRNFSYRKVAVPSKTIYNYHVYAWEISYNKSPIIVMDTLKEVKEFIKEKANT